MPEHRSRRLPAERPKAGHAGSHGSRSHPDLDDQLPAGGRLSAFFRYSFDRRFTLLLRLIGVRPERDGVRIDGSTFVATFGPFTLSTPVSNLSDAHITDGYRWYRSVGPRLSLADRGVTFGTNARRGVCVHFQKPVQSVLWIGRRPHPALTVTVDDCEGLLAAIGRTQPSN